METRNKEQGTRNKEQGTRNKEQGTRNKEDDAHDAPLMFVSQSSGLPSVATDLCQAQHPRRRVNVYDSFNPGPATGQPLGHKVTSSTEHHSSGELGQAVL